MKTGTRFLLAVGAAGLLNACASGPDHFYRLQALPATSNSARQQFVAEVSLRLSLPSLVDRSQIVLDQGSDVLVLEHQRWAAPLIDQLHSVLGQDLEQRRPDILMTSRPLSQRSGIPRYAVQVEIVALTLHRGSTVQLEARWRVERPEPASVDTGREVFTATPRDVSPAALVNALSECVAALSDRLASSLSGPV